MLLHSYRKLLYSHIRILDGIHVSGLLFGIRRKRKNKMKNKKIYTAPFGFFLPFRMIVPCCVVMQLKELEKLGPKKGVITQSVKDVVQSLVDDDLAMKDKIGTSVSVLFWRS